MSKKTTQGRGAKKLATSVRVPEFTLITARKIAESMNIKFSDYNNLALHDANEKYEKKLGKKWLSHQSRLAS